MLPYCVVICAYPADLISIRLFNGHVDLSKC